MTQHVYHEKTARNLLLQHVTTKSFQRIALFSYKTYLYSQFTELLPLLLRQPAVLLSFQLVKIVYIPDQS